MNKDMVAINKKLEDLATKSDIDELKALIQSQNDKIARQDEEIMSLRSDFRTSMIMLLFSQMLSMLYATRLITMNSILKDIACELMEFRQKEMKRQVIV